MNTEITAAVGLAAAVALLILLVLKTKVHAVLALVIAASIAGLAAGMAPDAVIDTITAGFGSTLGTIGLVIGLGVMMGRILEVSGAAEKLAYTLIRWLGKRKEEWAMAAAGFIISIPIFVDSAFVILQPLVKSLARTTGRSVLTLGIALAGGLILTHHAVPPTPGPLGAAGIFGVSIGEMIMWGLILTLPAGVLVTLYAKVMGPRIEAMIERDTGERIAAEPEQSPAEAFEEFQQRADERDRELPSLFLSVLPILLPIVLIFFNTFSANLTDAEVIDLPEGFISVAAFLGNPVIALLFGVLAAVYGLTRNQSRQGTLDDMEQGVQAAGIILLVTGAGGALGEVLRESGSADAIGETVAGLPLPTILVPFLIATVVRVIQGSGTVAIITSASISAPILAQVPDVNMVLAAQAAALGSLFFGYFNDSFFWVVNRMLGVKNAKHQMLVWSVPTTIAWATTMVMLLIASVIV
ncbi:GntP family permease [Nesterenkonia lacusekhoensis]|uniref:GntP family gluconate:H+ symporter n=1 Tax=Nesterenkonia lacusekhoensis TaxID=150832 RepID=A0ABS4T3B7_9MICC|nr:gluconate:H+ symporter [Nesterenkonia lacusekhoensis]MBP2318942.1 GntP family gluconate:H+ symporter [Nesterenkonia lacusekhoensis]